MLCDITLDANMATVLFFLVPSVTIALSITFYVLHKKLVKRGHPNGLKWLINPLPLESFIHFKKFHKLNEQTMLANDGSKQSSKTRGMRTVKQIIYRIIFSVIIAAFGFTSEILAILFHECGHGFVGEMNGETWIGIHIGVFYGYSYGSTPYQPDLNAFYYKEIWGYAAGVFMACLMGIVFLLFLLIPQIRRSFYTSLFCFVLGIVCITGGIEGWYGEAWNMLYGMPPESSDLVSIMTYQADLHLGITPQFVLECMVVLMVFVQIIIHIVGGRVWRNHYPAYRFSHLWFIALIETVWWFYFFSAVAFN